MMPCLFPLKSFEKNINVEIDKPVSKVYAIPGTPAYAPTNEHVMEAVTFYQLRVKTVCQRTVFLLAYTGTVQELNGLCRLPAGDPAASF